MLFGYKICNMDANVSLPKIFTTLEGAIEVASKQNNMCVFALIDEKQICAWKPVSGICSDFKELLKKEKINV